MTQQYTILLHGKTWQQRARELTDQAFGKEIVFLPISEEGFLTQLSRSSDRREENQVASVSLNELTFNHFDDTLEFYS